VRHVSFGEGDYGTTEELIRELLTEADPAVRLPAASDVPDTTPTEAQTPETYLGYEYAPLRASGTAPVANSTAAYRFPGALQADTFALGGTWTSGAQELTAGRDAQLELSYSARDVYLVLGGTGTVTVRSGGATTATTATLSVTGVPRLYPLVSGDDRQGVLTLAVGPGVQAYDFTFG
jgi:Thioredoxin like C-terminal domain